MAIARHIERARIVDLVIWYQSEAALWHAAADEARRKGHLWRAEDYQRDARQDAERAQFNLSRLLALPVPKRRP